jgi:cell division protein FtsB
VWRFFLPSDPKIRWTSLQDQHSAILAIRIPNFPDVFFCQLFVPIVPLWFKNPARQNPARPYIRIMKFPWKKIITNKYFIASVVFAGYMIFADKNNVIEQYELQKQYTKIKREHQYYEDQIKQARQQYDELFTNDKSLEKFAREKYLMKRDDEDVFVIVKPQKEEQKPTAEE